MTAMEIISKERASGRNIRRAVNSNGSVIAGWSDEQGRWIAVAGKVIGSGEWYSMPYELLIDGKPMVSEWIEV